MGTRALHAGRGARRLRRRQRALHSRSTSGSPPQCAERHTRRYLAASSGMTVTRDRRRAGRRRRGSCARAGGRAPQARCSSPGGRGGHRGDASRRGRTRPHRRRSSSPSATAILRLLGATMTAQRSRGVSHWLQSARSSVSRAVRSISAPSSMRPTAGALLLDCPTGGEALVAWPWPDVDPRGLRHRRAPRRWRGRNTGADGRRPSAGIAALGVASCQELSETAIGRVGARPGDQAAAPARHGGDRARG